MYVLLLSDEPFQPDLANMLDFIWDTNIKTIDENDKFQYTQIWGKSYKKKNLLAICWRPMNENLKDIEWMQNDALPFRGVIMTFNLAQKGALQFYRQRMFEVQDVFNDDVKLFIITTLNDGEKRQISKKQMYEFRKEHGDPPYFECNF